MSIFNKIKQGLGIGTAKVELTAPAQVSKSAREIQGSVSLTAKSDQKVKTIKVALVEISVTNINNERREVRKDLHSVIVSEGFALKKDENRTLPFTLPIDMNDSLSVGIFGGTLTISASSGSDRQYQLLASADLEGVALDPTASQTVYFTN